MRNNFKEPEELFSKSIKYPDCLSVPIGTCGEELSEMRFSCRGRLGNMNGYLVWGSYTETKSEFISSFLLNACKKYTPEELRITIFDNVGNRSLSALGKRLPHFKDSVCLETWKSMYDVMKFFEQRYTERLKRIALFGEQCFAHAAAKPAVCAELNMPQELIIFNYSSVNSSEDYKSKRDTNMFFNLITQRLWRVGIYPVFVNHDNNSGFRADYEYYFPNVIVLGPNITQYKTKQVIGPDQALNYTGRDSWNMNSEREEITDLPYYPDEWYEQTVKEIQEKN